MDNVSFLLDLVCSSCGLIYPSGILQTFCSDCKAPLLARYDLPEANTKLDRDMFITRPKTMWRWFELLPVIASENIVTLGEGDTPLLHLASLGHELKLPRLFIKEEGINPTGSFKARGMAAAVSKAKELGVNKIVIPSAGNAGGALAAYAARAGIDARVIMPKSTPQSNIIESEIVGSTVTLVNGMIDTAGLLAQHESGSSGWFNLATFKEPYRVEGKKIIGYEIAESLNWVLPDVIIYPTGGGTGLIGMWKAFNELKSLGWLDTASLPRLISVQADGCAPVVRAIQTGAEFCVSWDNAHTVAAGLCVPKSFADRLILKIIRESNGTAISVSDPEILSWQKRLARSEGIYCCPEGAATLAGLEKLIEQKKVNSNETIVVFNTAAGIKY